MANRMRHWARIPACSALAIIAAGWSVAATAQEASSTRGSAAAEEGAAVIVVTGSRIASVAPVGSTVTAIGRDDIEQSAALTLDRMIKELPQVFDLGVSESSRGQAGGSGNATWGNSINLRGIGAFSTLIILDGHRMVSNGRAIDPSVIPSLGVQRVEVIADGASAIYGSDAIAGVVNIIPRRNLDGAEFYGRIGSTGDGDFWEWSAGAALGKVFDRGQVMVAYEHAYRSNLSGLDRDFFVADQRPFGGKDYRSTQCSPGTIIAAGTTYAMPAELTPANAGSLVAGSRNLCETRANQDLLPESEYDSVNATGTFEVVDNVDLIFDGFYSRRTFSREPGAITFNLNVPETNAFFVRPPGFAGNRYVIDYSFENDVESNTYFGHTESWQLTPGVRVRLPYDWSFEGIFGYGKTDDVANSFRGLDSGALNAALASSDPATAFDPYGLGRTSQAVLDGIFDAQLLAPTKGRLRTYQGNVSGPLFALPGGEVKLAAGYERQEFQMRLGRAGTAPGSPVVWSTYDRSVDSLYSEILLPLFGAGNATAGFQDLQIAAAIRHDKYSDVGTTTNPKIGVNWTPFDGFRLRGSYGTSFRAPSFPEIFGNSSNLNAQAYSNPNGPPPTVLAYTFGSGPNPDLGPETATTWTAGIDLEPLDGMRLSFTYFDLSYENQIIGLLSNLGVLAIEDQYAGTGVILRGQAAKDRIEELLAQGIPLQPRAGQYTPDTPIADYIYVDGRSLNLGRSIMKGIDFDWRYATDIAADHRLTFQASGTYLLAYKVAVSPVADLLSFRNEIFQPLTFKGRASVSWDHGPFTARALLSHVGGYTNTLINPQEKVSAYDLVDLSFNWRVGESFRSAVSDGLELTFEVRNAFGERPSYVNYAPSTNGGGGYDPSVANPLGRVFAVGVRKRI